MVKIEGGYYSHRNKENLDLSDVNYIKFNTEDNNYFDIQFKNGELQISGSSAIKITLKGGNNCVNIGIEE